MVKEFRSTQAALNTSRDYFNAEVRLADVQEQNKRHEDLVTRLDTLSSSLVGTSVETITTMTLQRNHRFTGRKTELESLHSNLQAITTARMHTSHDKLGAHVSYTVLEGLARRRRQ